MNWPLYESRHEPSEADRAVVETVEKTFRMLAKRIDRKGLYNGEDLYKMFTNLANQARQKKEAL